MTSASGRRRPARGEGQGRLYQRRAPGPGGGLLGLRGVLNMGEMGRRYDGLEGRHGDRTAAAGWWERVRTVET